MTGEPLSDKSSGTDDGAYRDKWLIGWSICAEDLITIAERAPLSSSGSLKSH